MTNLLRTVRSFRGPTRAGGRCYNSRSVAWICGLEHVRETIAFPRMLYRMRP